MIQYKITLKDGTFFKCGVLSDENIKNLKMVAVVKSISWTKK